VDVNGDGRLDLVVGVGSNSSSPNSLTNYVSVLLGNGDGTFQPAQNFAAGLDPARVTVADFNGDGTLDVAVTGPFVSAVTVIYGDGDGTFGSPVAYPVVPGTDLALAAGDFNRDGHMDLAVATFGGVSVLLGTPLVTPLTVTASDASRVYGAPNPPFTGTVTGAANGDTVTESSTRWRLKPRRSAATPSCPRRRAPTWRTTP
jgi:hypothetical protein